MSKSEIEKHVMKVFDRVYNTMKKTVSIQTFNDVELTKARAKMALAASNLTRTIIEAERDQR